MSTLVGKRLVHVTTVDMSLVLLLGPQLRAFADAGLEVIGVWAPGPFVPQLGSWGIRHVPLRHTTRSVAVGQDVLALLELWRLFSPAQSRHRSYPQPQTRPLRTDRQGPGSWGTRCGRTPCTASMPARRIGCRGGHWCTPSNAPRRRARAPNRCKNPEDLQVLSRLGVPPGKLVLLGQRCRGLDRFRPAGDEQRRRQARADLGVGADDVVVGMVPRLVWQKGFRELFDAAERLPRLPPRGRLRRGGRVRYREGRRHTPEQLDAAMRRGRLVFAGKRDDIEDVYPAFDLFVIPSYREGFPRSAMEAAASGLPVVATDIRGCRQAVSHGLSGLLVPIHDADRLASGDRDVGGRPSTPPPHGRRRARKAEAEFDDQSVVSKTLDAYERVLTPVKRSTRRRRHRRPGHATVVAVEIVRLRCLGQRHAAERRVAAHHGGRELLPRRPPPADARRPPRLIPPAPRLVDTTGTRCANDSRILTRVPPP